MNTLIFDMDGVITDTEGLHKEAEQYACKIYGISLPITEWKKFKGRTIEAVFSYIVENFTDGTISVDDLIRTKNARYKEVAAEKMALVPGSLEFIRFARTRFQSLGLVTSSNREILEFVFQRYRLYKYFDVTVTGDDIPKGEGKPHPRPYLLALEKLQSNPQDTFVIEDSANGIISAGTAGCRVIGITTSFSKKVLEESGAEIVVDSFIELYHSLKN